MEIRWSGLVASAFTLRAIATPALVLRNSLSKTIFHKNKNPWTLEPTALSVHMFLRVCVQFLLVCVRACVLYTEMHAHTPYLDILSVGDARSAEAEELRKIVGFRVRSQREGQRTVQ